MADKSLSLPMPAQPANQQMPFSRPSSPHAHPLQIGFCGLGNMGYRMARNLATHKSSHLVASPPLLVYNRTVSKSEELVREAGGEGKVRIAQSIAQLAIECDIIITNLGNDDVVKSIYVEFSKALSVRIA
jgi:3-hydroxyisobutyrate dehydrogenase-like beta-hydroxyacid dehydrogenase